MHRSFSDYIEAQKDWKNERERRIVEEKEILQGSALSMIKQMRRKFREMKSQKDPPLCVICIRFGTWQSGGGGGPGEDDGPSTLSPALFPRDLGRMVLIG